MPEFVLDTSGAVIVGPRSAWDTVPIKWRWQDLDAFTQGYIEAMMPALNTATCFPVFDDGWRRARFSDLAPETLARIIEDCDWLCTDASIRRTSRDLGREIWAERQAGNVAHLVPLTAYLGDDGKVYLS